MIAGQSDKQVTDIGTVPFEIVEEGWNEYTLADQTIVRTRCYLRRVGLPPPSLAAQKYMFAFERFLTVVAPLSLRGIPSTKSAPDDTVLSEEKIKQGILIPVSIITSSECWNVYRLPETGEILQAKMIVAAIYRMVGRYDDIGEPKFLASETVTITPLLKGTVQVRNPY